MQPGHSHSRRSIFALLVLAVLIFQSGYLILENELGNTFEWQGQLIRVQLWNGFQQSLAGGGGAPRRTLIEALNRWTRNSSALINVSDTGQTQASQDGVNLVTMASGSSNSQEVSGRLAVTLLWSQRRGQIDTITEADIIFNPNPSEPWSVREGKDSLNFFDVAVHEFGHLLGMHHAISATQQFFCNFLLAGDSP